MMRYELSSPSPNLPSSAVGYAYRVASPSRVGAKHLQRNKAPEFAGLTPTPEETIRAGSMKPHQLDGHEG
jgi:hypothetical protein